MLFKAAYKYSYHKNIPLAILFAGYNENSNCYCCASFGKCIFHALLRQFPFASWALHLMCVVDRASVNLVIWRLKIAMPKWTKKRKKKKERRNEIRNEKWLWQWQCPERIASHRIRSAACIGFFYMDKARQVLFCFWHRQTPSDKTKADFQLKSLIEQW